MRGRVVTPVRRCCWAATPCREEQSRISPTRSTTRARMAPREHSTPMSRTIASSWQPLTAAHWRRARRRRSAQRSGVTAPIPPTLSTSYTLPSGNLQAVRANFRYQGSPSSCSTGAYDDHDDLIFAVGAGAPGFTVSAAPSAVSVTRGSTANNTITVTSQNGFNSATTLSASGLPAGVTAAFSTNPVTPPANGSATSTLTFTASSTATTGTSTVTVTGTSGSTTKSTPITLTVNAS